MNVLIFAYLMSWKKSEKILNFRSQNFVATMCIDIIYKNDKEREEDEVLEMYIYVSIGWESVRTTILE